MSPEDRKKWEVLQEQKALYLAEQAKKKAQQEELEKRREYDARERAQMEVKTSKVNSALKPFASDNKAVFKPPEPRKGG